METKVIIDSDILIDFMRGNKSSIQLIDSLSENHELYTTDINLFELYYGAYRSNNIEKNIALIKGFSNSITILNTNPESMEISGRISANLNKSGNMVDIKDVLIAGICLINNCLMATNNKKDFERLGVKIISYF